MDMFCYQCEQSSGGKGCDKRGVCGKDPQTAALQDLLVYAAKGISQYANKARQLGAKESAIDIFVVEALFSTVTNVNFDAARLEGLDKRLTALKDRKIFAALGAMVRKIFKNDALAVILP